jgi:26S proteasome regulatory subunit N2
MVALAMVIIQTSHGENPKVEKIRQLFESSVSDKHEETMAKFGAILAIAIVNAGGRNVTISPLTSSGYHKNMCAIVGLTVFCQYWYWYPLLHFLSLTFTPIATIGLNVDLNMPVWEVRSNAPPSRFAYPPEYKPPQKEAPKKVTTAVLSTSKKAKARAQQRAEERGLPAPVDGKDEEEKEKDSKEDNASAAAAAAATTPPKEEPTFELKSNPARVTTIQRNFITCDSQSRWQPVKQSLFGIVLLRDTQPSQPIVLVTDQKTDGPTPAASSSSSQPIVNSTAMIEDVPEREEAPVPEEFDFEE